MVGAYTLPELRIQLKIFRLRLGANEREDADKIFYDDLPDSWNVLRLGALEDTLKMILDGHLTWAGIQELFEREAMTGEWVTSIGNLGLNYWLPSLVNAAVGWVTRGPTEQRTFQQWIQDHNIPWRTVVGRKPSETNWKIIRKLLLYLQAIQYRDLEPEADGNPADNEPEETRGMDFVFERLTESSKQVIEISDSSDDDNAEADSDERTWIVGAARRALCTVNH
ncbi:uncharacterized protein B0H18DRAFT_961546 [Fomitopsis serialis]|uniref:uncharacterized protein n=1 Tax=Fomitopsis serialis TaxID=139415 RepID=UPI002007C30B|nr:uncharacterized protein B0H18DRAFT_961546 [Neoantrodia serialis]KAH9911907.1 hypothetical protein B0H18DRAFT_961546 [Neoantrodia serialis]